MLIHKTFIIKILRKFVLLLVVVLALLTVLKVGMFIDQKRKPKIKEEPVTQISPTPYFKVGKIEVKKGATKLKTPQSLPVYELAYEIKNYWQGTKAITLAQILGFRGNANVTSLGQKSMWRQGAKVLIIDLKVGFIDFSGTNQDPSPALLAQNVSNDKEAIETVKKFLEDNELFSPLFYFDGAGVKYYNQDDTKLVSVIIEGKVGTYPVLNSQKVEISFNQKGEVLTFSHFAPVLNVENPREVLAKPLNLALEEAKGGMGILAGNIRTEIENLSLDEVSLVYFANPQKEVYFLEPAYLFGSEEELLIISAIKEEE